MSINNRAATHEPPPVPGTIDIGPLVLQDIQARIDAGKEKYGTLLQTHNCRDALMDAYQEAIDLCMYLKQSMLEGNDISKGGVQPVKARIFIGINKGSDWVSMTRDVFVLHSLHKGDVFHFTNGNRALTTSTIQHIVSNHDVATGQQTLVEYYLERREEDGGVFDYYESMGFKVTQRFVAHE